MKIHYPLCLFATAGALFTACGEPSSSEKAKPNILIILLDDAGYNDFGFMGSKDLKTPNIDALAIDGVRFTDAHVSASVSGPSRAGILTGRYQQRCGYECNLEDTLGLGLNEITIADAFRNNGYSTACIGKWHQGNALEYHPNRRGFEHFFGFISGSRSYFYRPDRDDKPGNTHNLQFNGTQQKFDGYITDVLADNAAKYIDDQSKKNQPFMMYLAFNAVHTPMEAADEDMKLFEGHKRQKLAAMTWAVDRGIGKVIDKLKENGIYDNTLIFFLSDNGGAFNNQSTNYPLKGFKGNKFEGGHRVPFFMVNAGVGKGEYSGLTSSLDIFATAATFAGIDISTLKNPLDGVDIIPYIKGEKSGSPHTHLFWRKEDMAAMRTDKYKYIRVKGVGEVLYSLEDNLSESEDIKESLPDVYKQMSKSVADWEKGLVNPILWGEGIWNDVTREIHRDLMNNRKVRFFSPAEFEKKK
ncbi:MAG: sulfatase-like hydrolase/transferase [Parabacteroides sp.]|nr:sulfatase-like hydrolase/transferase [Parabacteroides sp.]